MATPADKRTPKGNKAHRLHVQRLHLQRIWQDAFEDAYERRRRETRNKDMILYLAEHDADAVVDRYCEAKHDSAREGD